MANFDISFEITLGHEGGYSNDPNDRGGETYKGIARNANKDWSGWAIIDKCKSSPNFPKSLDSDNSLQTAVKAIYKTKYWDCYKADTINNQEIANELFDTGVNQGTFVAGKYLQEALNILNRNQKDYPDLKEDGIVGNATLSILNSHKNPKGILKTLNGLQFMRYFDICKKDPTQEIYFNGWLNRS